MVCRCIVATFGGLSLFASPFAFAQNPPGPLVGSSLAVVTYPTVEPNRLPSTGPFSVPFYVKNIGNSNVNAITNSCIHTGPTTCGTVNPTDIAQIVPGDSVLVTITYSTTSVTGSGSIGVQATPDIGTGANKSRIVVVANAGKAWPKFANHSDDNVDRGLCLTVGAGEAAGLSCGDLFVVQSMPVYRTLGRDRSLGLLYNSAAATGLYLLATNVSEPGTIATPDKVKLVLTIGTSKDSAEFGTLTYPYSDSLRQMVLGRGLAPQPTGIYAVSLLVRNVYGASVFDTTITGTALIVNRATSEYGRGWALLGVEQLFSPPDTTQRLWVAGDASIRVYTQKTPGNNVFVGAAGDAPDSLVRFDTVVNNVSLKWYRRDLKHGAAVYFDQTGRHQATRNRLGALTTFTWGTVAAQTRLLSITVPPNGGGFTYQLYWNATTAKLDSIEDPYLRALRATMTLGSDTTLTRFVQKAPFQLDDWDTTSFEYTGGRMTRRVAESSAMTGGFAGTVYQYQNNARVTKVKVPSGLTGSDTAFITITPWDEKGLALAYSGQVGVITRPDTGLATRVDGPLSGTGDAADVWVNRFGQPVISAQLGLLATTLIWHDSTVLLPGAVTRVQYPNGRIIRMSYNARGNLTELRDSTSHLGVAGLPTKATTWTYGDATTPDSPTRVADALGRHADYLYNSLGLLDSTLDSRGLGTKFFYRMLTSDALRGSIDSVVDRQVETWLEAFGTDTAKELLQDQANRFVYDHLGNDSIWVSPAGVATAFVRNQAGFVTDVYDGMNFHRAWGYDGFNRVTGFQQRPFRDPLPGFSPLAQCDPRQVACSDSVAPYLPPNPGGPAFDSLTAMTSAFHYADEGADSVADPRGISRRFRYDSRGNRWKELDDYDLSTTARLKAYFNVTGTLDSTRARSVGAGVHYRYDAVGRVTAMVLSTVPDPHMTAADSVFGDSVSYAYDVMGNVLVAKNRWGTITRSYYADGSLRSQATVYGSSKDSIYVRYDATGARTRLIRAHGANIDSVGYAYDATSGDLDTMRVWWAAAAPLNAVRTLLFARDKLGRRRQVTYPNSFGMIVKYRYDAVGLLRRVFSTNRGYTGGSNDRFSFTFANLVAGPAGRFWRQAYYCPGIGNPLASVTLGSACGVNAGGMPARDTVTNKFNRLGMLVFDSTRVDIGSVPRDSLRFDRSGNLTYHRQGTDSLNFVMQVLTGGKQTNVLTMENFKFNTPGQNWVFGYTQDEARNYESRAGEQAYAKYWYDALGRTSGISRLGAPSGPNVCQYNADGEIGAPCTGAPYLAYDGPNVGGAMFPGTTGEWDFVSGPGLDDPLIGIVRGTCCATTEFYWVTDGQGRQFALGTPDGSISSLQATMLTDEGGSYAGGTASSYSFAANRFSNASVPLVSFFRNRVYDQQTGRWTQEDPVGLGGGLNLYGYAANDPVTFTDPFGLKLCFSGDENQVQDLKSGTENATNTKLTLDKNNCVSKVESGGDKRFDKIRKKFNGLVDAPETFTVRFTRIFNSEQISKYYVDVYEHYNALAYPAREKGKCVRDQVPWDINQVLAHELYHHYPVPLTGQMDPDENAAVGAENVYNRASGRPIRCEY